MTDPTQKICPQCQAPIPENAPQGLCPKCVLLGAAAEPAKISFTPSGRLNKDAIAPHFPELEIVEELGSGGMGTVFKARQPNLDRFVALKVLSGELAADPAFTERFSREARVLARLNHPHIVTVYDSGMRDDYAFFMMEFVDGVNLRQAMKAGGFDSAESLSLVQDVCSALKFAHENGILHRDIKPENILIDARGQVKIADFGIAKLLGENDPDNATLTMDGVVLGTPKYMAPEQIETPGDVDQRADIYSLGVVLYELLTGELPLGRFALPSEKSAIDARIDDIVLRTLHKERELRYQSADEVKTDVQAVASTNAAPAKPAPEAVAAKAPTTAFPVWPVVTTIFSLLVALAGLAVAGLIIHNFVPVSSMSETASDTAQSVSGFLPIAVGVLVIPAIVAALALPALVAGWKRLALMSRTGGVREGFARAMFCALAWPVVMCFVLAAFSVYLAVTINAANMSLNTAIACLIFFVTGSLAAYVLVSGTLAWVRKDAAPQRVVPKLIALFLAPTVLAFVWGRTVNRAASPDTLVKPPPIKVPVHPLRIFSLRIAPGMIATLRLVQVVSTTSNELEVDYEGFILSADDRPWSGSIELYQTWSGGDSPRPNLAVKINADPNSEAEIQSQFAYVTGDWEINQEGHSELELGTAGSLDLKLARPMPTTGGADRTVQLRIEAKPRRVEGVPDAVFKRHVQREHHLARGGAIDWTRHVMKELEQQLPDNAPRPPREPEPEWQHGEPEVNLPFTLAPGLVATMELVAPTMAGGDRESPLAGHAVASDLDPFSGAIKLGSVANPDSMMHWRIDGPYNSASLEKALGELKLDQSVTNNVNLTVPGIAKVKIGSLPAADLFLRFTTKQRVPTPGLPRVLVTHHFGLGSTDWTESLRMAYEMMNRPPTPRP